MKSRIRRLLERRFGEWSAGKTLTALSAAALLGLTATEEAAFAQYGGSGSLVINPDFSGAGSQAIAGVYGDFKIDNCNGAPFNCGGIARLQTSPGQTLNTLLITDLLLTYQPVNPGITGPGTFTMEFAFSSWGLPPVPAGPYAYGASIDGSFVGGFVSDTEGSSVAYKAGANGDVINSVPGGAGPDSFSSPLAQPSLSPFLSGGTFSGFIIEDLILCGIEGSCNPLAQGAVTLVVQNPGEQVLIVGSIAWTGCAPQPGNRCGPEDIANALGRSVPTPPTALLVALGAVAWLACRRHRLTTRTGI